MAAIVMLPIGRILVSAVLDSFAAQLSGGAFA
jgi:hypothetical protein